ncbi:hypothetical protein BCR33DRAFT_764199 [Rhizoclosmatium globosum]|uniref:Zn(2)-C6 fungal-type domain-containing protein n=1 Tax=Rhizoclosmatium globosum TaxID=329046 RepID=A0A1Y2CLC6_9FUNG|nr:hypothetical protein BCR33DRAFT_764199 [Rhizoclosmatium globosum]|eukprot:ORY47828.1 hypothetical protein BCR33DRAFT_764199 [Rhizoclosmatium globosum]
MTGGTLESSSGTTNKGPQRSRATRACDTCKRKRQKCCGSNPCTGCVAQGFKCTFSVPQMKRGPKKEEKDHPDALALERSASAAGASGTETNADLHQRVLQMEKMLAAMIRNGATPAITDTDKQSNENSDQEFSEEDEEDREFDDQDINFRGVKRPRITEVLEDDDKEVAAEPEGGVMVQQIQKPTLPDVAHLINALNASNNPEKMRITLDMMNQLQFIGSDLPSTANRKTTSNTEQGAGKHEKGFRGIALSLQRKMRRGIQPSPLSKEASSPSSEFLVSSPASPTSPTLPPQPPKTVVEDLASDTILFFGSTSTTTSSAWRQSPRFAGGIMNISLSFEANPPCAKVIEGDYSPPCKIELVLHLVGMYFKHVHPYFPMIQKARFFQQLKEKKTDHFNLLLNSMCALMSQQCRDLTAWGIDNPVELHMAFFERARVLLGHQFDWPHINNVQALLLLCIVGQGTNINATSYHYIGIAHRLAVELGMHRNLDNLRHPSLDPELLESMRTTWFCLYVLDRYTSVVEGRPMAISDEEWDTPFPASKAPEVTILRYHVGLCEILGRIANFVNRPGRPGPAARTATFPHLAATAPVQRDSKKVIAEINSHLQAWHQNLPPHLQQRPASGSTWSFHHHLYSMYHTASVLLHRLDVGKFDQTCSKNAAEISKVLDCLPVAFDPSNKGKERAAEVEFVFVVPLIVYSALTASTLFLDLALANKAEEAANKKRKSRSSAKPTTGLAGKVTPEASQYAARQLRKSLIAFDRLKTTSLFANYYGQLIVEVLRNDGIVLPTGDLDEDDMSPSPAYETPPAPAAPPTQSSLFNFFSNATGGSVAPATPQPNGSSGSQAHHSESMATRFANQMKAAVAEGVHNWNDFIHFSPKLQNNQMAIPTVAPAPSSTTFMNAASNLSFPHLPMPNLPNLPMPNLPNLPNIPNPINALREFGSGLFGSYGFNPTLAGSSHVDGHGNHLVSGSAPNHAHSSHPQGA